MTQEELSQLVAVERGSIESCTTKQQLSTVAKNMRGSVREYLKEELNEKHSKLK